jgi:hypothetical protein
MEKGTFERSIKDAFDKAESTPSGSVWTGVELGLEKSLAGTMKKRLLYYKLLAAASLVLMLGVTGLYYLSINDRNTEPLAVGNTNKSIIEEPINQSTSSSLPDEKVTPEQRSNEKQNEFAQKVKNSSGLNDTPANSGANDNVGMVALQNENSEGGIVLQDAENYSTFTLPKPVNPIMKHKMPALKFKHLESNADPGMVLLAKLKDEENKYAEKNKKSSTENIWTSVGFSAGSFNPNSPQSTIVQSNAPGSSFTSYDNNPSAGSSYSVGIQVGGRVSERVVLLGGVSYLTQNSSYTSNTASLESSALRASLNDLAYSNNQSIATSPYEVSSNLQYLSLPVQAGYIALDRNFAIQLNGGLSTDFFMVNTLTPSADNISKFTQGSGSESPYRPVTFSGLVGTEFSYRFSDRYRLAVNPGMRYALSSIYKSDSMPDASPVTYDVALRFRYLFK